MHFEISEIVEATDVDLVVQTLEEQLRALAKDVVRSEQQLTAFGIGPSPMAKNARDRAVFHASAVEAGTCVRAEVNYQASGLLGDVSQNEVVRDKILGALQETRTMLRHGSVSRVRAAGVQPVEITEAVTPVVRSLLRAEVPSVAAAVPAASAPGADAVVAKAVTGPAEVVTGGRIPSPVASPVKVSDNAKSPQAGKIAAARLRASARPEKKVLAAPTEREAVNIAPVKVPLQSYDERENARRKGRGWGWVAVLVLVLGAAAGWRVIHPHGVEAPTVVPTEGDVAGAAGAEAVPRKTAGTSSGMAEAGYVAKVEEQDLNAWLLNWAEAMESRDAEAQTAFYADPVDWYFLNARVGHAALLEKRRVEIESRDALSTVKIEGLAIVRQTEDSATVRLLKYSMNQSGKYAPIEQHIRSQLKVKRVGGDWKIVEEHDLK